MALLNIDQNDLSLTVKVGVLEEYRPSKDIEDLNKEVEAFRQRVISNKNRIIGKDVDSAEALKILKSNKSKEDKWKNYIGGTYKRQLKKLQQKVRDINKKICPNFEEQILSKKDN